MLVVTAHAAAGTHRPLPPAIQLGYFSHQDDRTRASVGAGIRARRGTLARNRETGISVSATSRHRRNGHPRTTLPAPYPPLKSDSAFAQNPEPLGPGSFWYTPSPGRACPYAPEAVTPCYTLVGPGIPTVDPTALAADVADRLPLVPGRIHASPRAAGLTGARSWFWLDPGPAIEELTVTLAGETVTVTAEPSIIEWRPGDGTVLGGGAGIPYRSGQPPEGAIVHTYQTRCLPGDQGRNPYVLATCGAAGYPLEAAVTWTISFSASGPIDDVGALPARTTVAEAPYPVSESRAFLLAGASQ
jgi:hypothetical protein